LRYVSEVTTRATITDKEEEERGGMMVQHTWEEYSLVMAACFTKGNPCSFILAVLKVNVLAASSSVAAYPS